MIKKVLTILVIVFSLALVIYFNLKDRIVAPIPAVTVTPSEEVTSMPKAKGEVEGKICFPSSFVPEGYILAKNIETSEVEKTYFEGVPPNSQDYSLSLNEGKYVFAYAGTDEIAMGFYTACAPTASINDCSSPESHELIEVDIRSGDTVSGIDLCDYYYQAEEKPDF